MFIINGKPNRYEICKRLDNSVSQIFETLIINYNYNYIIQTILYSIQEEKGYRILWMKKSSEK